MFKLPNLGRLYSAVVGMPYVSGYMPVKHTHDGKMVYSENPTENRIRGTGSEGLILPREASDNLFTRPQKPSHLNGGGKPVI